MESSYTPDGAVLRRLAHDLKNPLTAVFMLSDLIRERLEGDGVEDLDDLLSALDDVAQHADTLSLLGRVSEGDVLSGDRESLGVVVRGLAERRGFAGVVVEVEATTDVDRGFAMRLIADVMMNGVRMGGVHLSASGRTVEAEFGTCRLDHQQVDALLRPNGVFDLQRMGVRSSALGLSAASHALAQVGGALEVRGISPLRIRFDLP